MPSVILPRGVIGNTADSGSAILGSSPSGVVRAIDQTLGMATFPAFFVLVPGRALQSKVTGYSTRAGVTASSALGNARCFFAGLAHWR